MTVKEVNEMVDKIRGVALQDAAQRREAERQDCSEYLRAVLQGIAEAIEWADAQEGERAVAYAKTIGQIDEIVAIALDKTE